jgi:hypothetical protein
MSFNIAEVFEQTVTCPFEYTPKNATEATVIMMEVYVERVTSELLDRLAEATEKSEVEGLRMIISETVKSWGLDWNGEEFPPSLDNIQKRCPLTFLAAAGRAIIALWAGNPTIASSSENTLEQTESVDSSPDITSSSEPLAI